MALLTTTKTWLEVAATTIENYRPKFFDQVTDAIPLIKIAKDEMSMRLNGGDGIVETLMYAHNNTVGSVGPWDVLDLTPQDVTTAVKDDWKIVHGSVVFASDEIERNSGEAQMKDLLMARIKNLRISFASKMNTMLYADGTGNGGKDVNGLALLIGDTGTETVHGVSAANEAWWRNVGYSYYTSDYLGYTQGGTANSQNLLLALGDTDNDATYLRAIDTVYSDVLFGDTGPHLGIASFAEWRRIRHAVLSQKEFDMGDTGRVDPSYKHVNFNGVPIVPDRAVPATVVSGAASTQTGRIYWVNMDFFNFYIHEKKNFVLDEFRTLKPKQDVSAANMFLKAQAMVNKRNAHAVLHSI